MFEIKSTPDGRVPRATAAEFLGLSKKTLCNWATRGLGPRSVKIGGRRFYYLADLTAFVADQIALKALCGTPLTKQEERLRYYHEGD